MGEWPRYVYAITNKMNGRVYIGISQSPQYRFQQHLSALKGRRHPCEMMQEDFDKYGEENFTFELLQKADEILCRSEKKWMIQFKTYDERYGYNCGDPMMNKYRKEHGLSYRRSNRLGTGMKGGK